MHSAYTVNWPVQRPSVLENQLPERGNSSKTRLNHKRVRVDEKGESPVVSQGVGGWRHQSFVWEAGTDLYGPPAGAAVIGLAPPAGSGWQ